LLKNTPVQQCCTIFYLDSFPVNDRKNLLLPSVPTGMRQFGWSVFLSVIAMIFSGAKESRTGYKFAVIGHNPRTVAACSHINMKSHSDENQKIKQPIK
jgi:hypothetical protein